MKPATNLDVMLGTNLVLALVVDNVIATLLFFTLAFIIFAIQIANTK